VEGRHFTTGCGLRGVRQSTSRTITQFMAFIIHYSHATYTFADHHVLRAVVENECFRPDLTVFNHWETAVTKKSVVFVPLYTLCGKVQNYTEGLQVICRQFAP